VSPILTGVDHRFEFAVAHNSLIPFAHTSVLPYLSMPPRLLEERAISLQDERGIFGMTLHPEEAMKIDQIGISNEDDVTGYMSPRW
jgi:beta-1,2-xylosyltransferase